MFLMKQRKASSKLRSAQVNWLSEGPDDRLPSMAGFV